MIGTLAPIRGAAVAHEGKKTLAMLRRRQGEAVLELLAPLDAAIATAKSTGSRVDEINDASSDRRYEIWPAPGRQYGLGMTPTIMRWVKTTKW